MMRRMSDRESLRRTFDDAASGYDRARPSYPERLFEDLIRDAQLVPGGRLLEIGCGTGKATLPLLRRGFRIDCVEMGGALAREARGHLAGYSVEIHVAPFERWEGEPGAFDLVYSATAWHWLDPGVRYLKAYDHLRPSGHLAFWSALHGFPSGFDSFFAEIQDVYDDIGESYDEEWPPPPPDQISDDAAEIEATGLFGTVQIHRYVWEIEYTADEYIALLNTFSGHIAMEPDKRDYLYQQITTRLVKRPDSALRRHWYSILHVARRVG
jgi:SAM-dependent methyltransferase